VIHSLSGTVLSVGEEVIHLDVSGFGIEVFASGSLLSSARAGEALNCFAYLQISDAGITMFGFSDETERSLFLEITQVKTMGGKLSITLLRRLSAPDIVSAIMSSDLSRLTVPGLGSKRAERICFEIRSKIERKFAFLTGDPAARSHIGGTIDGEVIDALMGLGFTQGEAARAISLCRSEDINKEWGDEELMMSALGKLQRR
jgi:Holliday junction DNA helicase RuvA